MTDELTLTESEQNIYNAMTEAEKVVFRVFRLASKVERREIMSHLQNVTQDVQRIKELQTAAAQKKPHADEVMMTLIDAFGKFYEALKSGWKAAREQRNKQ